MKLNNELRKAILKDLVEKEEARECLTTKK